MSVSKRDNMSLGAAGLAAGTSAGTYKTTNILHFVIDGRAFVKAATDNVALAAFSGTSFTSLAASQVAAFFVMISAAGALTIIQSPIRTHSTGVGYVPGAFEFPDDRAGFTCIGAFRVATNASGAFVPASTSLGAANQTVTYFDVALDYSEPIQY